jgi:hypothetical protein
LYLFLVLASDRNGLSFYSYDAICSLLQLSVDEYIAARNGLIGKDLIAFDGTLFQVLELPQRSTKIRESHERCETPRLIGQLLREAQGGR